MDNYPEHLKPAFVDLGVAEPFEEWWPRVKREFPNVPEEIARYWLHEHWNQSPFEWIPSASYHFERTSWPTTELAQIRSYWCDFDEANTGCLDHGRHLITGTIAGTRFAIGYRTSRFMSECGDFPTPIIVLDNRDGHLVPGKPPVPPYCNIPPAYVLVEGHRRFNMALYLSSVGRFVPTTHIWLMVRAPLHEHSRL
jgi:hypothetical protein